MKLSTDELASILDFFKGIDDPRGRHGRRYRLETLLSMCAAATMCGAHGWKAIFEWVQDQSPAVLSHFRCRKVDGEYDRPSIYCIRNIMTKVDPGQLSAAIAAYCRRIGWDKDSDAIAVDGKTIRGSAGDDGGQTHVLGACAHGTGTPIALKKTVLNEGADEEKRTNEIGVFKPMMDEIPDIAGKTVTVDALPAQKEIAAYLHGRGAHYMFVAKGNHPGLFEVLTRWAQPELAGRPADHVDEPKRPMHGRLEKREIWTSTSPLHMITFPWARQVFAIRKTVRQYRCAKPDRPAVVGEPSVEIVVGITSHTAAAADAVKLLALNRSHWTVENRVHRVLDEPTGWNEDHSKIRSGHGPENMSCLRRLAIRLVRAHADFVTPMLRKLARKPRLALDYLRLTGNHRKRAPA